MSQWLGADVKDVVPFGGDNHPRTQYRPNQCICGRSMSEKWSGDRCAFCAGEDDDE